MGEVNSVSDQLRLVTGDGSVRVSVGEIVLAEYVTDPGVPQSDSPKPYLHPLRTIAGDVVSAVRPHDHTWHNGLQFTVANLSGENFWGGRTYVRGRGYTPLDNNGSIRHVRWEHARCDNGRAELRHELAWRTAAGECWLTEHRTLDVAEVYVRPDLAAHLANPPAQHQRPRTALGEPGDRGQADRRLRRAVLARPALVRRRHGPDLHRIEGEDAMGHRAPWLAYTGQHDVSLRHSTLLFADCPANVRYPTAWYVRAEPFPVVSFAVTFHRPLLLEPGEELGLTHHAIIADGRREPERLERSSPCTSFPAGTRRTRDAREDHPQPACPGTARTAARGRRPTTSPARPSARATAGPPPAPAPPAARPPTPRTSTVVAQPRRTGRAPPRGDTPKIVFVSGTIDLQRRRRQPAAALRRLRRPGYSLDGFPRRLRPGGLGPRDQADRPAGGGPRPVGQANQGRPVKINVGTNTTIVGINGARTCARQPELARHVRQRDRAQPRSSPTPPTASRPGTRPTATTGNWNSALRPGRRSPARPTCGSTTTRSTTATTTTPTSRSTSAGPYQVHDGASDIIKAPTWSPCRTTTTTTTTRRC